MKSWFLMGFQSLYVYRPYAILDEQLVGKEGIA
jgi:hypothetical protein